MCVKQTLVARYLKQLNDLRAELESKATGKWPVTKTCGSTRPQMVPCRCSAVLACISLAMADAGHVPN